MTNGSYGGHRWHTTDDTRGLAYARKRAFKEESEKY